MTPPAVEPIPIESFMATLERDRIARVPGTAVFLTARCTRRR